MSIQQRKAEFEKELHVYESVKLNFLGAEGFDVYNCSIPFIRDGEEYIYGRVEKRDEWARSWVMLFRKTGKDTYTLVEGHMIYQLEDPYIAMIGGEMTLGGTHVRKRSGKIDTYYGYFYRGTDINDMVYFTTGPDEMKDIRLVDMKNGGIGVFSRPRNDEIVKKYGSASMIGFTVIHDLNDLTDEVILGATPIEGLFDKGEWGGCNQAYMLQNGKIGVIGHQSYVDETGGVKLAVYLNISFEFNPDTFEVSNKKVIGTRKCYPEGPAKLPYLADCTFTSGIVVRPDGKADLYGGLGDTAEGRITIDYPFDAEIL